MKRNTLLAIIKLLISIVVVVALLDFFLSFSFSFGPGLILVALMFSAFSMLYAIVVRFRNPADKSFIQKLIAYSVLLFFITILGFILANLRVCGYAITYGRNTLTNQCKTFSNTCMPPWYKSDQSCS